MKHLITISYEEYFLTLTSLFGTSSQLNTLADERNMNPVNCVHRNMSQRLDYIVKRHYSFIVLIYHFHLLNPVPHKSKFMK
jgi:hypothetical protein